MTDLDKLRKLEKAATPGPWAGVGERYVSQAPPETSWPGSIWHEMEDDVLSVLVDGDINEANVRLIVAMRNALPDLLDVAEAAQMVRVFATNIAHWKALDAALAKLNRPEEDPE